MANNVLKGWIFPTVVASIVAVYWLDQLPAIQRAIGSLFPVVSPLEITSIEPVEFNNTNGSKLSGHATKRLDCTYEGLEWRLVSPYGVPIAVQFLEPPHVNAPGEIFWSGLLVGIEPSRINETYAEVIHTCHGVTIRTHFFAGQVLALP